MLAGRRIVLGVTGGVAAYKAAYLARRLGEAGADVRVVMTGASLRFVGAHTMAAITGHHPVTGFFDSAAVSPHTELAAWADGLVVAPATTATLARLAAGVSDDVLVATLLATTAPVLLAPAMHTEMWEHPATQRNIATLRADGYHLVGPETGSLAGGDSGVGRMSEPDDVVAALDALLTGPLDGAAVVVSAGGTREAIDPVRYIGNRSSGKMGHAIALEAAARGASVTLVTSAVPPTPSPGLSVIEVETAVEMAEAVWSASATATVVVLAAAVADFRPKQVEDTKLRRAAGPPEIVLEPTPDILAGVAAMDPRPYLVGFAAETGSLDGAIAKATTKGVDLLVGNDVSKEGSGFGTDTNEVVVVTPDGDVDRWPLLSKREVAARLWDRIAAATEAST